jgi:DNA-binding beta-propeller fold protein YncE
MGGGFVFTDPNGCCLWTVKPPEPAKILVRGEAWPRKPLWRPSAIAFDPSGGLVVTDPPTGGLYAIKADGTFLAIDAPFEIGQPRGLAFDKAGNLFVAGSTVDAVYRRGADGKWAKFADVKHPRGLALLEDGSLLVVSPGDLAVYKVSADGKTVAPLHKGAPFENPLWIALDGAGNAFVSDNYAKAVFKIPVSGGAPTPLVKGPPLDNPAGVWWDALNKRLLLADAVAKAIYAIGEDGKPVLLYQAPK